MTGCLPDVRVWLGWLQSVQWKLTIAIFDHMMYFAKYDIYYLRHGEGYAFIVVRWPGFSVCLSVSNITGKRLNGFSWHFQGRWDLIQGTIGNIFRIFHVTPWTQAFFPTFSEESMPLSSITEKTVERISKSMRFCIKDKLLYRFAILKRPCHPQLKIGYMICIRLMLMHFLYIRLLIFFSSQNRVHTCMNVVSHYAFHFCKLFANIPLFPKW